jgi:hypothetical protein
LPDYVKVIARKNHSEIQAGKPVHPRYMAVREAVELAREILAQEELKSTAPESPEPESQPTSFDTKQANAAVTRVVKLINIAVAEAKRLPKLEGFNDTHQDRIAKAIDKLDKAVGLDGR